MPKNDLVIWINRKGEDWANDLDLSFLDINLKKIWRNSDYNNKEKTVIYSWDMTLANPEATELLYFKKDIEWMVNINRYCWEQWSKYTLFICKRKL